MSAYTGAELVRLGDVVGTDGNKSAITNLELTMELNQALVLPAVLGTEAAAAEHENHRMLPLHFGKPPALAGMVGKLIIREDGSWDDVGSHGEIL